MAWNIASITMIALLIFYTPAFMVLLLPWMLWGMGKEIGAMCDEYEAENND